MNDNRQYGQLLDNATALWEAGGNWFPTKWATARVLRRAAADPAYQAAVAEKAAPPVDPAAAGSGLISPPTLHVLVALVFDVVLLVYGPSLPLGGFGVRIAKKFVLNHLNRMAVPAGLLFQPE